MKNIHSHLSAPLQQIRAVYDEETIRVYQAFSDSIADAALNAQHFVSPPFSMTRMTWIKPSFLWMMYRSGWALKDKHQHRILAIDILREGFDWSLANGCPSHFSSKLSMTEIEWRKKLEESCVRIQWDPERDLEFNPLPHRSLQIGLRGLAVENYVHAWIIRISDVTEMVRAIHEEYLRGGASSVLGMLPIERPYPIL